MITYLMIIEVSDFSIKINVDKYFLVRESFLRQLTFHTTLIRNYFKFLVKGQV